MNVRRIDAVLVNRANYARSKTILEELSSRADCSLNVISSGSTLLKKFGEASQIVQSDGFESSFRLYSVVEGDVPATMVKSTALAMLDLSTVFQASQPDLVLTIADRYETLATSIAASYMNIPLAHTQGGEVSGSIDERVRHAVTKLANLHFPATERAYDFLIRMGEDPDTVFLFGCPSIDLAKKQDRTLPNGFFEGKGGVGFQINEEEPYLVVMQHPVTTEFGEAAKQIEETIRAISVLDAAGFQVIWIWPNVDSGSDAISNRLRAFREERPNAKVRFFKNLSPEDYLILISNCVCLIGNSSSGIRESAYLGVPVVNIGNRQKGREHGPNVISVPHDSNLILSAVEDQVAEGRFPSSLMFGNGHAGERIAEVLATHDLSVEKSLTYLK